ncbi:Glutamate--tRNA ligase mitochondrial [Vermiconidia calcicola]|uniref:Glutamate--tRNA ligase mitochondrial n=1 Tax=Vermiconidia calcicola TaxID=1690605 RepID=A0ACC3NTJ3_9PEZI|nr:Glutamate--tRNA ligase mitochondrial [Vermiconidia calcicola]
MTSASRASPTSSQIAARWICASCRLQTQRWSDNPFSAFSKQWTGSLTTSRASSRFARRQSTANNSRTFSSSSIVKAGPTRTPKLPNSPARTRFAPSPTGHLHIGGLRTALFSYLLAKRTGGQFLLRIEDTDQKRLVPDAETKLSSDLQWAGLQWDEGPQVGGPYGPYRQSERTEIYQEHASILLEKGSAYRCFCTPRAASDGLQQTAYVTSGCYQNCSSLSPLVSRKRAERREAEPFTIRLHQPLDAHKRAYPDLVYGKIQRLKRSSQPTATPEDGVGDIGTDDTILVKSDGTPTYHFANVIDDHLMRITHVIRGAEWMASTPLHYDIYSAFGWEPPLFAHVGLLVDQNQTKLSKRHQSLDMALDVASMRDVHGVLPEVLCNFLCLLGWSNPTGDDVMGMEALMENFDLKFTRGNAMVRMEKLWFLQKKHVAQKCLAVAERNDMTPLEDVLKQVEKEVGRAYGFAVIVNGELTFQEHKGDVIKNRLSAYCADILLADSKIYQDAKQWVERNRYFFAYDTSLVPEPYHPYDDVPMLVRHDLRCFVERVLNEFRWPPVKDALPRDSSGRPVIENLERRIHAHLVHHVWCTLFRNEHDVLAPLMVKDVDPRPGSKRALKHASPLARVFEEVRARDTWPTTAEDIVRAVIQLGSADAESVELLSGQLQKVFKTFNTAAMKYMRERLSYGLPGPSVSWIMAVLGEAECRRRLLGNANGRRN